MAKQTDATLQDVVAFQQTLKTARKERERIAKEDSQNRLKKKALWGNDVRQSLDRALLSPFHPDFGPLSTSLFRTLISDDADGRYLGKSEKKILEALGLQFPKYTEYAGKLNAATTPGALRKKITPDHAKKIIAELMRQAGLSRENPLNPIVFIQILNHIAVAGREAPVKEKWVKYLALERFVRKDRSLHRVAGHYLGAIYYAMARPACLAMDRTTLEWLIFELENLSKKNKELQFLVALACTKHELVFLDPIHRTSACPALSGLLDIGSNRTLVFYDADDMLDTLYLYAGFELWYVREVDLDDKIPELQGRSLKWLMFYLLHRTRHSKRANDIRWVCFDILREAYQKQRNLKRYLLARILKLVEIQTHESTVFRGLKESEANVYGAAMGLVDLSKASQKPIWTHQKKEEIYLTHSDTMRRFTVAVNLGNQYGGEIAGNYFDDLRRWLKLAPDSARCHKLRVLVGETNEHIKSPDVIEEILSEVTSILQERIDKIIQRRGLTNYSKLEEVAI